jgi:hypothetical protein
VNSRRRKATEGGPSCGSAQQHRTLAVERDAAGVPLCPWDADVGRELRESPVPAHRPDHFQRVRERIRELAGRDHSVSVGVAGDLTRDELTGIAGSRRPIGD